MKSKYAIIAIGFNRVDSIERLLKSLTKAEYLGDSVDLVISVDYSGQKEVEELAEQFQWSYGEKIVRVFNQNQGLRRHVLSCGEYLKVYDAIAVFEDDIIVSPSFYTFMKQAVNKYENDSSIAGVSLYSHLWNVNTNLPFQPAYSSCDTYFMQFAQSWGQVWMKKQWSEFIDWYKNNSEELIEQNNIPVYVTNWPRTSWLKYHIKYCIDKDKYFVYPYKSLTTCFTDVGVHCKSKNTKFQVPMLNNVQKYFVLSSLNCLESVVYDAFFERVLAEGFCNQIPYSEICIDIYGYRKDFQEKRYVLTTQNLQYNIVNTFGLETRPHELNFILKIEGAEIRLYDLMKSPNNKINKNRYDLLQYHYRMILGRKIRFFMECDKYFTKIKRCIKGN